LRLVASLSTGLLAALLTSAITGSLPRMPLTMRGSADAPNSRQQWLIQAGLDVTIGQFAFGSVAAAFAAFAVFLIISGVWTVALVPGMFVGMLPVMYFGRVRQRRLAEVARAWPDGLRDIVATISSGASLQRAIEQMTVSGPQPLRDAFQRFPFLARTVGVVPALEVIKEELADPTTDRVVEVLILAHERGGRIVPDILRELAVATTRDVWTLEEIETQALEQKINSRAVFVLPWIVLVAITFQDGAFRDFYGSGAGTLVVLVGAAMSAMGIWLVARLGREPAEPRVFGGARTGDRT
jgi:tight adherence protein B